MYVGRMVKSRLNLIATSDMSFGRAVEIVSATERRRKEQVLAKDIDQDKTARLICRAGGSDKDGVFDGSVCFLGLPYAHIWQI